MFGIGLSYLGITPLVAQADGQGDDKMIVHVLRNGILLCAFAGAGLFLLLLGLAQLMPYMAQPADVLAMGKPYFLIIASSLVPLMFFQCFRQFAEGKSITKPTMFITVLANVINIIFNYLLIYGKFGFPEMGLNGAGHDYLPLKGCNGFRFELVRMELRRTEEIQSGLFNCSKLRQIFLSLCLR